MKRGAMIVAGVAAVALAAGWLSRAVSERQRLEAEVAALERNTAAAKASLAAVQEQLASTSKVRVELERTLSQRTKKAEVSLAQTAPRQESARTAARTWSDFLRSSKEDETDPKVQLRDQADRRSRLVERYGPFYRLAGLSPEAIRAFGDNCVNREVTHRDLNSAARAQGIDLNDPGIVRMRGDLYKEYDQAQRALLGEAGYAQFLEYERTSSLRSLVSTVAGAAAVEGAAFSPGQAETVLQVLASASSGYQKGRSSSVTDIDWAAVEPQLATLLTPAQMAFFRTVEAPGGVFHARWNGELIRATEADRARKKR